MFTVVTTSRGHHRLRPPTCTVAAESRKYRGSENMGWNREDVGVGGLSRRGVRVAPWKFF